MTIFGWDASDFDWQRNGVLDLASARVAGVEIFTHKATEGTGTKHIHYAEAMSKARDAGVPFIGPYVVPRTPGSPVAAQVDYLLSYVDAQTPWWSSFPGWFFQVDLEHWYNSAGVCYDAVPAWVGTQMAVEIRRQTGKWTVLYAPKWAYGNSLDMAGVDALWSSDYGPSNNTGTLQGVYAGRGGDGGPGWGAYSGVTPTFWQYGSRLTIGSNQTCDGNAYRGTVDQLRALITGRPAAAQEDEQMHMVTASRTAPGGPGSCYAVYPDRVEGGKMLAVPMSDFGHVTAWQAGGVRMVDLGTAPLDPRFYNIVATDAFPTAGGGAVAIIDTQLAQIADAAKAGAQAGAPTVDQIAKAVGDDTAARMATR